MVLIPALPPGEGDPIMSIPRPRASGWPSTRCGSTARMKRWWPRPRFSSRTGRDCWVRGAESLPQNACSGVLVPPAPHPTLGFGSVCAVLVTPTPSPESSAPPKKEKDTDGEKEKKEKEKRLDVPSPNEGANPHPAKHPKNPTEKHREKHKERCGIQCMLHCHRTRISLFLCQSGGCSGAAC